jgi:hypothetical protein
MEYYSTNGFDCDAAYFDLAAANAKDKQDRKDLRKVAVTYRTLAKNHTTFGTRREHWIKRAEECRTLADQFQNEACRIQLIRLADTYDLLAGMDPQIAT